MVSKGNGRTFLNFIVLRNGTHPGSVYRKSVMFYKYILEGNGLRRNDTYLLTDAEILFKAKNRYLKRFRGFLAKLAQELHYH